MSDIIALKRTTIQTNEKLIFGRPNYFSFFSISVSNLYCIVFDAKLRFTSVLKFYFFPRLNRFRLVSYFIST